MTPKRTILVTGASRGIGRTIAERLAAQGHDVIGLARGVAPDNAGGFSTVRVDLAELDALPARLADIGRDFPEIDTVVCCAGRGQFGSIEEFSYPQIRELMDLNFTSQAFVARAFLPLMKRRGYGDVVFIGSEAALSGARRGAVYCASKFALRGLAQALREECAKSGVRISIVNPGMVRTEFFDELHFRPGAEEANAVRPEDVADAVALILNAPSGTVFDEINLSPLKKVVAFKREEGA